jgi:diguanylate cyclase (GGDEF)-like protein
LSKSSKVYLIYAAFGLIPLFLILFLDIDPITGKNPKEGSFLDDFTNFFQYPLYMGFALVGFLCFKINQNRMLFSVLLFLGISFLLINPNTVLSLGIEVKGLHYAIAMSFPLTLAIIFSIRETRPMDFPNFGRLLSSLLPIIVLGYLAARDIELFNKIADFKILPVKGFLLPQLALVSLTIFGVVVLLQRDRIVKSFVRVLGISMIPLMAAIWAGLKMYWTLLKEQTNLAKLLDKYPDISLLAVKVEKAWDYLKNFVDLSYPSLHVVAAFTVICAILLHVIFQMYWHRVYVDELTDIPNRRALDERLSHLSGEYAIAMMDIDHFKAFNDNYGHDEGDNVLRLVGRVLSEELGDRVYRYGGEEFCAVFTGVSAEDAYMYANKVRRKLEERDFYIRKPNSKREPTSSFDRRKAKKNGKKVQITISIGLANPNKKAKTADDVIKLADQALYEAKRKGRNRVIIWEIEGVKSAV